MEGGRTTELDFDEFEMLLGEIPKATLGNPHSAHPIPVDTSSALVTSSINETKKMSPPSSKFTNMYNSPRSVKNGGNMAFFSSSTFQEISADQKHQINGTIEDPSNGYEAHALNGEQDKLNLPDEKYLALALEELSFKETVVPKPSNPSLFPYNQTSQNHRFLNNSQSLFGIDTSDMILPSLHQSMNGVKIGNHGNVDFSGSNYLELKKQMPESLSSDLLEQQPSFPVYSGAMPLNPRVHAYQMLPNIPVPGIEFTTSPYQQQFLFDAQASTFMPPQHLGQSNNEWQSLEEERYYRLHQQYLYQQLHNHRSEVLQLQKNMNSAIKTFSGSQVKPYYEIPSDPNSYWNDNVVHNGYTQVDLSAMSNGLRQYHPQGSYGRVEGCEFPHRHQLCTAKKISEHQVLDRIGNQYFPEKILTRSHGVNSVRSLRSNSFSTNQSTPFADNNAGYFSDGHDHHLLVMNNGSLKLDSQNSYSSSPDSLDSIRASRLIQVKYNSVDEVKGRIYSLARDQHGCRFLQRKFTEGSLEDVNKIFVEIIGYVVELMTDPFGNYLIQKIIEVCTVDQRVQIIHAITREAGMLIRISCNMHGTRAVQKVIETLQTTEQIYMVVSSLKAGIVSLIKDVNGNHVAQRCLQYFSPQQSEFLFDAAISHCVEIATDRQGCCVLQKCVHHSYGDQRNRLMSEICSYSLVLSQDPFGNYVVQYVLDQKVPWVLATVLDKLQGNFGHLSMQKHSSNVVETCLKLAKEEDRVKIIRELINSPQFLQILQDAYGNYVIQSALKQCKGPLNTALVEAIKPHVPMLRSHPYGKKVLSSTSLKK